MRIYSRLKEILISHKLWTEGNLEGVQADLAGADLTRADLTSANLSGANLYGADLEGTIFPFIKGKIIYSIGCSGYFGYFCDGFIKIGCMTLTIQEWIDRGEQIGKGNNYSDEEIETYMNWIRGMK